MSGGRPNFGQMEAGCRRPGLWYIEGYRVERVRSGGKVQWRVYDLAGEVVGQERRLEDAAYMVDDHKQANRV